MVDLITVISQQLKTHHLHQEIQSSFIQDKESSKQKKWFIMSRTPNRKLYSSFRQLRDRQYIRLDVQFLPNNISNSLGESNLNTINSVKSINHNKPHTTFSNILFVLIVIFCPLLW